jgi:hypothetical protein
MIFESCNLLFVVVEFGEFEWKKNFVGGKVEHFVEVEVGEFEARRC